MSRYVHLSTEIRSKDELIAGLQGLGLDPQVALTGQQIMLQGSLECAGDPVDIRLAAGTYKSVEDCGFVTEANGCFRFVCGELDRDRLRRALLTPLLHKIATARAQEVASVAQLEIEEIVEANGTRRIKLRTK